MKIKERKKEIKEEIERRYRKIGKGGRKRKEEERN
jgi:hypothetical protein